MYKFSRYEIASRKNFTFRTARFFSTWGLKHLSIPHIEIEPELTELKKENSVFLYTGLHKSLWETTGVLSALYLSGLEIPFAGMGDNLIKGKFFHKLARKAGVFVIKRAKNRREILESAKQLKEYIISFLAQAVDVMVYPEGTRKNIPERGRYGDFFPTVFEATLEYEKNKKEIVAQENDLAVHNSYIIPFNVDYSHVREAKEMVENIGGKPRTLHILDSLSMIANVGHTFISFGKPIKVSDNLDKNRKELSLKVRKECLDLVKILPINLVAQSFVSCYERMSEKNITEIDDSCILESIKRNMDKLKDFKESFRLFSLDDSPVEIWEMVKKSEPHFRTLEFHNIRLYRLYANYIEHYFSTSPGK